MEPVLCRKCGKSFGSLKQLERIEKKIPVKKEILLLCPDCRRKRMIFAGGNYV